VIVLIPHIAVATPRNYLAIADSTTPRFRQLPLVPISTHTIYSTRTRCLNITHFICIEASTHCSPRVPNHLLRTMYIPQTHNMALQKRDNMGYQIHPSLIVLLVILGAGFCVCVAFAIYQNLGAPHNPDMWQKRRPEQDAYMRDVRERNWLRLEATNRRNIYPPTTQNIAHAPISPR
jgi:hypothetical protein